MDIFDARMAKPMLIAGESKPFDSDDYQFELKMDGERCLAYLDGKATELVNRRNRRILPQFPELADMHRQAAKRCIIDGEMIVGLGGKQEFELIKQRALVKRPYTIKRLSIENPCTFVALDILYIGDRQVTDRPLTERQAILRDIIEESDRLSLVRTVDATGTRFFEQVKAMGLEGIIAKQKDSLYRMGKRTREWTKIKNWEEADFVICGYIVKAGVSVASIVLGQYDAHGVMVYKGRVTLGLNREDFRLVAAQPKRKSHPFADTPPDSNAAAVWLQPRLVCRVAFMCWTASGHLRQPYYKQLLPDASPAEIVEPPAQPACAG